MATVIHSHTTVGIDNVRTLDADVHHRGFTIPTGFTWDGASVPRPFWFIMPKWGENSRGFLVHDYLYSKGAPASVSRAEADSIMYTDLLDSGVSKPRAWLVYKTVRVFGGGHFRK